jgi:cyclase
MGSIIKEAARDIFIPLTVGGGIRKIEDVTDILRSGADKVAINTAAVLTPKMISEVAKRFGSQCMVSSIEAKKISTERWEVYTNNGRERTGLDVIDWAKKCEQYGAGEILLTSVDQEGTRKGFDIALIKAVSGSVSIPIIASGGMGVLEHAISASLEGGADAIAMADILHYNRVKISEVRFVARTAGLNVRQYQIV